MAQHVCSTVPCELHNTAAVTPPPDHAVCSNRSAVPLRVPRWLLINVYALNALEQAHC